MCEGPSAAGRDTARALATWIVTFRTAVLEGQLGCPHAPLARGEGGPGAAPEATHKMNG